MIKAFIFAYRFYSSKRYGVLAKFMSFASSAGICVGVMALIVGLSAMNGFEDQLEKKVFDMLPSATINSQFNTGFKDVNYAIEQLQKDQKILTVAAVATGSALLEQKLSFSAVNLLGVNLQEEQKIINIKDKLVLADKNSPFLKDNKGIILGKSILTKFNLKLNDSINIIINDSLSDKLIMPKRQSYIISGYVDIGGSLDESFCLMNIDEAMKLLNLQAPNSLHIKTVNFKTAYQDVFNATYNFKEGGFLQSALQLNSKLYNDIQLIRQVMYIAMFLVMIVASFNIISKLILAINEKGSEIAILKTMGASSFFISLIFTLNGFFIALFGIILGTILGILIAYNLPFITSFIEQTFNITLLNKNVYFIDFIPSRIDIIDVLLVVGSACIISLIASSIPAFKASKNNIINML